MHQIMAAFAGCMKMVIRQILRKSGIWCKSCRPILQPIITFALIRFWPALVKCMLRMTDSGTTSIGTQKTQPHSSAKPLGATCIHKQQPPTFFVGG